MLNSCPENERHSHYAEHGYFVVRNFFTEAELALIRQPLLTFFEKWKKDNSTLYEEEAFNASLITGSQYLSDADRLSLFNFIGAEKLRGIIDTVISGRPAFMNTQLFFNPVNPEQNDFWHRDCQYDHDIEGQKKAIQTTQVVHFRVPLFDELGVELVPGSHTRWDNEEEFAVRQEEQGRVSSESLATGQTIPLETGDLLVFSADMIHRGLYGLDRLAFDILVFDTRGNFVDYVDDDCLPNALLLEKINDPRLFKTTLELKLIANELNLG